jgi:hypothetical protein
MRSLIVGFAFMLSVMPAFADEVTIHLGDITGVNRDTPLPALTGIAFDGSPLSLTITWTAANIFPGYQFFDALINVTTVNQHPYSMLASGTGYFIDGTGGQITPTEAILISPATFLDWSLPYGPATATSPAADTVKGVHWDLTLPSTIIPGTTIGQALLETTTVAQTPEPVSIVSLLIGLGAVILLSRRYSSSRS